MVTLGTDQHRSTQAPLKRGHWQGRPTQDADQKGCVELIKGATSAHHPLHAQAHQAIFAGFPIIIQILSRKMIRLACLFLRHWAVIIIPGSGVSPDLDSPGQWDQGFWVWGEDGKYPSPQTLTVPCTGDSQSLGWARKLYLGFSQLALSRRESTLPAPEMG